jgi:hypothetical protein
MKRLSLVIIFSFLLTSLFSKAVAFESSDGRLHDGKGNIHQTLNYRTHQDERSVKFSSARTTFRIEGYYDLIQKPELDIKLYGLFNYWYDSALYADHDLRDAIRLETGGSHQLKEFKRSNEQEEIIKELYVKFTQGACYEFRLGKQLVSWGETAEARVADIINPLDLANIIAFPDWEDYKVGLWMGRFFFTPPNSWQDIQFEFLFLPPDFQKNRIPPAGSGLFFGTAQGLSAGPIYYPNFLGDLLHRQRQDTPANDWNNTEFGLRIRGQTKGTDWTISTFYTRNDSPIIDGANGASNLQKLIINRAIEQFGLPISKRKVGKIFTYPRYQSTACTFARPWSWAKSVIRGEIAFNSGVDYNLGNSRIERDLLTTAISWDRDNMVPWLSYWNRSRSVTTSVTWYNYKLFGHERGMTWEAETAGLNHSTWNKLTVSAETGFLYDTIYPVFNFVYDCNTGATTVVGALRIAPGDHWRWLLVYQQVNEVEDATGHDIGRYQNQVIFSMRYEF